MKILFLLLARHVFAALSCVYLFSVGWLSPRNRALISHICSHFNFTPGVPELTIPKVELTDVVSEKTDLQLHELAGTDGNVALLELVTIANIVRRRQPKAIFEIGTFDGRTTLNMAANSPDDAKIQTLDLPQAGLEGAKYVLSRGDKVYVKKETSGARFKNTEYSAKITQHYGDSATFDFSAFHEAIDFVFIDGAHTYDYLLSDTRNALRMLRNGKGVLLWHDYGRDNGATFALHRLFAEDPRLAGMRHIAGTSFVYCSLG